MSESAFLRLEDAILDDAFPEVDMALRRGRHVDRDDGAWFTFLVDAQVHLEAFYRRFGCELMRKPDGYFYLLPVSERLGRRQLSTSEMLVGQALTLMYLDPATIASGGVVTRADVLSHLSSVVGVDVLIRILVNPKRRKFDERAAHETVRARVFEAMRRLATMGFVDAVDEDRVRLRASLMRFAEPVRGTAAPSEALQKLVASGEVVLAVEGDGEGEVEDDREVEDRDVESDREVEDGREEDGDLEAEGDLDAFDRFMRGEGGEDAEERPQGDGDASPREPDE